MTPDAFMQAIVEDPEDDTPRLVFADWLEDHGQPGRAEFIRTQIELARLPDGGGPRRAALEARERVLLAENGGEWAGPLPRTVTGRAFERGFLAGITMKARGFPRLREVLSLHPTVRRVHLCGPFVKNKPAVLSVASSPLLGTLASLEISDGYYFVGPAEVAALAASPHVAGLTALSLHNNATGDGGLAALAGSPHLGGLTDLSLSCCGFDEADFLGVEGAAALAASPNLKRLATLRLAGCGLGDEACRVLEGAGNLAGLRVLDLSRNPVSEAAKGGLRARLARCVVL